MCILPKKGCQIITINSHSKATPSIIKMGHQNCNMWLNFCHTWLIFVYLCSILSTVFSFIHLFSFFILQEDLPSKSFAFAKHFENTAFAWQWMGMWLQATTVSWMGHWKETVQSTDTVHGTCPAQWQNVERDTETRFCLQTGSKFFVFYLVRVKVILEGC